MSRPLPHLFVDISSHGFGHLAQTAPVLQRLGETIDGLRLTIRSGLPEWKLKQRIALPFAHIAEASDIGYVMRDALAIDLAATAAAYRSAGPTGISCGHADFSRRVADEAQFVARLKPDAVFANVSCLPLAGAARAGIPAAAMCSLNWADLFVHYFGGESWAAPIHADMIKAYRSATFLRLTPGMPMPALDDVVAIGPIAALGHERRGELREKVGCGDTARVVLVALGGIPTRLPVESWPALPNTRWLVPAAWTVVRPDMTAFEPLAWPFTDLLRSVDAVVTKPGYGTFAEAACNGAAVLYQRREDWPEQDCLIEWLHANARAREVSANDLQAGAFGAALDEVLASTVPPAPTFSGVEQAAQHLALLLK